MKALIRVRRNTEYASIVEMTQADFDKFNRDLDAGGRTQDDAERQLNRLIDPDDWQDDELDYLIDFEVSEE